MFEIIAVTSMTATGRGYSNFWICSVHVSTLVEVDTMVLRIFDHRNMTWLPAYVVSANGNWSNLILDMVVVHRQLPVTDETRECTPTSQAVIQRFGRG